MGINFQYDRIERLSVILGVPLGENPRYVSFLVPVLKKISERLESEESFVVDVL